MTVSGPCVVSVDRGVDRVLYVACVDLDAAQGEAGSAVSRREEHLYRAAYRLGRDETLADPGVTIRLVAATYEVLYGQLSPAAARRVDETPDRRRCSVMLEAWNVEYGIGLEARA